MYFQETTAVWRGTSGVASASQLVDKTVGPIAPLGDEGTGARQFRKVHIIKIEARDSVKRSKEVEFSRAKRKRKSAKGTRGPKKRGAPRVR